MKDLNRKIDRFIKDKAASAKKAKASTPHLTYKVTNFPSSLATTKAGTTVHGRAFSMTVSFFNPRFENPYPKDFAIRHENVEQTKCSAGANTRFPSPKRDPIIQNNDEAVKEDRPTIKCFPTSRVMPSEIDELPLFDRKAKGEYNHVHSARSSSPKIESIKTFITHPSDSRDENPRRKLKAVQQVRQSYNPITQGDPESVKLIKQRTPPEISEQTKKINDRASVLPCERELLSERANSARGRVFWDTGVNFGTCPTEREEKPKQRLGSPQYNRSGGMNSLIKYDFALEYRDQGVSHKCNNVPYSDRLKFDCELH